MDNYGMNMLGSIVIERVTTRPDWSVNDVGRFIYDLNSENFFLGAPTSDAGYSGWIALGLTTDIIKSYNIDWDTNLTGADGKISAQNIPIEYASQSDNIQNAINDIVDKLNELSLANGLAAGSIKSYHLDVTSSNRVSATVIPIDNSSGKFTGTAPKIEDALTQLIDQTASEIFLNTTTGHFGSQLSLTNVTDVQDALESLESYIKDLNATQIPCTYEGCGCDTNVQYAIDALYHLHTSLNLTDLEDVPAYDATKYYLKSNGLDKTEWVSLVANEVNAQYPGTNQSNVQAALWQIGVELDALNDRLNNFQVTAEQVKYTHPQYQSFDNVDDGLDYILGNFFSPNNLQEAGQTPCSGIGLPSNNNVQLALTYLLTQINAIQSQLPCSVGADSVTYNSAQGATNVSHTLDYIMGFIYYMITNQNISYAQFSV